MTAACECCGARDWNPRWEGFIICRGCGLMTVTESFDLESIRRHYGAGYFCGEEYIDYEGDRRIHELTLREHLRLVARFQSYRDFLLEIGAAYGFFLELARERFPNPVGVDISADAAAVARARGLDVRTGDLTEVDLPHDFDAVCLWDTVEHLTAPAEVIRQAAAHLRPGGHLYLTTGDFGSRLARWQGLKWRQIHPPTHLFYFTRRSLAALCERCGLEVVEFGTVSVYRRIRSSLDALVKFHPHTFSGRLAAALLRGCPDALLDAGFPLDLGDTLQLVARKPVTNSRST